MSLIRLDRFISNQTGLSRNEAKEMLKSLRVCVNGKVEKNYDYKINTDFDMVTLDGKSINYSQHIYILINKPSGVLTATEDKNQYTVLDLIPKNLKRKKLAPVGRLDKDTTGLLILTDDGDFAHRVISPKSNIEKEYIAELDGDITEDMVRKFSSGVILADGTECMPAKLRKIESNVASITIKEGKYHQIKRMFGTVGLGVNSLKRIRIGDLYLPDSLGFGEFTVLKNDIIYKDILGK